MPLNTDRVRLEEHEVFASLVDVFTYRADPRKPVPRGRVRVRVARYVYEVRNVSCRCDSAPGRCLS